MGYSIYLIDKEKSITKTMVNEVVDNLPLRLRGDGTYKQSWGWSLRTDVSVDKNVSNGIEYLRISGSFSMSGKLALDMVIAFQQLLQRKGFKIEIYSHYFGICNKKIYEWLGYDKEELIDEENF